MRTSSFQESLANAIGFREQGRIACNTAMLVVVAAAFAFFWPGSVNMFSADLFLALFTLCIIANVAYPVYRLAQSSGYRTTWLQMRWVLLLAGIAFAGVIAQFIAQAMLGNST